LVPATAEVDAPLTDCPEEIDTLMLANISISFSQHEIVHELVIVYYALRKLYTTVQSGHSYLAGSLLQTACDHQEVSNCY